jgi:hypothetical protein
MSLIDIQSAANAGFVDVIAANAIRKSILLMTTSGKRVVARRVTVLAVYFPLDASRFEYGCGSAT